MHRREFLKALLGTVALTAAPSALFAQGEQRALHSERVGLSPASKYSVVDSHLHYLDFLQETDGLEKLAAVMDTCGVEQAVLFGMPMIKQWDAGMPKRPAYYLSDDSRCYYYSATDYLFLKHLAGVRESVRRRFLPFVCGVNANDRNAAAQLRRLFDEFPGQIVGIGEIMSRHDDLTALTYGEPPRADHPALLRVYDLGAEMDMPVLLHHNIAGAHMDEPLYLGEMENALQHNRKTEIIWAHVGVSRRVELSNLPEIAEGMLRRHPNLSFDISWLVFENYIAKDDASMAVWSALLEKHQDRFLLGTDVVGHWGNYGRNVTKYYSLLDRLSPTAARKVCRENVLRLVQKHV